MDFDNEKVRTSGIKDLMDKDLVLPYYQRQYSWTDKNVRNLLSDISNSINDKERFGASFRYRIGTIILYNNADTGKYEIVDGQQRIITLFLLKYYLEGSYDKGCELIKNEKWLKASEKTLRHSYKIIQDWFSGRLDEKESYKDALDNILEVVVIIADDISEAFQMFDSQNSRGKRLEPHDLLKAYHLRAMMDSPYEMRHAVTKWETYSPEEIRSLFDKMYRIINWSKGRKSKESFTDRYLEMFYGISEGSDYTYAKRARHAMPYFQITDTFIEGQDFFDMTDHYLQLLDDVNIEFDNCEWLKEKGIIISIKDNKVKICDAPEKTEENYREIDLHKSMELFKCAMLYYYDKFHNFDRIAVTKLLIWSVMIRVDLSRLRYDSINNYAIGDDNNSFSNKIPMFSKIRSARRHTDISNILVNYDIDKKEPGPKQENAMNFLKLLTGNN